MLLVAFFTSALAQDAVRFDIADPSPDPGELVWWRVAWTNQRADAARVPADLLDRLSVRITVDPLASRDTLVYNVIWKDPESDGPLTADRITWRTVPAFSTIERIGDLSTWVPDCRGGCPPGTYKIEAWLEAPPVAGLAADQRLPALQEWSISLPIDVSVLPLLDPAATQLSVRSAVRRKDAAVIDLTVRNTSNVAAWYPGEAARLADCDWAWTRGRTPNKVGTRTSLGGQGTWSEADGVLIPAGGSVDLSVSCEAPRIPAGVKDVTVVVRVRPISRFFPTKETASPFWLGGELQSEPSPVEVGPL